LIYNLSKILRFSIRNKSTRGIQNEIFEIDVDR